jgi:Ca2+-binding RTX toxin-like protein
VIGRGTNALFELINAPLPSLVVLNPTNQSGTIVIGKPTGSATPTIVGSMPTSGAPVGVYTGNPFIDGVLQKVFSRSSPGQSDPNLEEIIKVVILEEIGKATGTNAGAISAAIQGDVQGLIDATTKVVLGVNQNVAELDERYKTQEDVNRAATVKNDTITGAVGNDTITGAVGNDTITGAEVKTEADKTKTVINKDTVAKTPPALEEVKVAKTPAALEEVKVAKRVSPDGPPLRTSPAPDLGSSGSPGSPGSPATPIQQPQSTQDMYSVSTEQAGLADIGTPYDLNASLIDNIMRILAERDAGAEETELYGGGSVNRYNATDELIKLLRG